MRRRGSDQRTRRPGKVVAVVSGGNIDLAKFASLVRAAP